MNIFKILNSLKPSTIGCCGHKYYIEYTKGAKYARCCSCNKVLASKPTTQVEWNNFREITKSSPRDPTCVANNPNSHGVIAEYHFDFR